jgi:VCBS repeat-containing protein
MGRIRRLAILPVLALLITAMAAISMPLANAGTSPDPARDTCALDHNGQLRYFAVPAECDHQGKIAARHKPQHKPPVLADIESAALRYAAGAPRVQVTQSLTVSSTATGTLAGATVRVSSGFTAGQDTLAFTARSGIAGSYSSATGVLTFTGTASVSAYTNELRSVTYRDTDAATPYGTRKISFQVSDGEPDNSLSNTVSRTVQVTAKPPVAVNDKATTGKNAPVTINVLANDTDLAGLPLTIASVSTIGTKGTVTVNPGQTTVTYNPNGQFAGLAAGQTATDKFTYKATDGRQTSSAATVTVTITGSGAAPQPPTVISHSYTAVGNTPLGVGTTPAAPAAMVSGTVLSGDSDADPTATLTVTATTTPAYGTVAMKPNGTFTYLPGPGYSGTDSFQCTIAGSNDPTLTATETVTIIVGTRVWYVNNSDSAAGNGEAASPFDTLAAATAAAGPSSILFLYQGKGAYTGGVIMQPHEDLWGQPHGLTVGGYSLVPAGGSAPAITSSGADVIEDGIDLAEGADVEGVNVAGPSASGIAAVNVNNATVGTTTPVAVSGALNGIFIEGGGDYGTLNFGATRVNGGTGAAVVVSGHGGPESGEGGSIVFGGPITAAVGGGGIDLLDNAGSTIAFTGTLTLNTGPNPAFTATGSGAVTATGPGSTLSSSGEGALVIEDTTIGAAGVTFQSVSSSSTDNSADSGIILDDTGSSAGVTVTGTGAPGSGGTIENSTGPGIQLTSTSAPSFTDMVISDNATDGIDGSEVNGLTLDGCTLSGNGTGSFDDGLNFSDQGGESFGGLTGTVSITNSTITGSAFDNADISDTSGTLNLTVSGSTFSIGGSPSVGGGGLLIGADAPANATVSVTGSTFTDNDTDAFQFSGNPAAPGTNSVTFSNSTVNSNGHGGVAITLQGDATNAIAVDGNNIQNADGDAIGIDQMGGLATPTVGGILTGTIDGNTIGAPTAAGSGGSGVVVEGWGTAETLAITGNDIYQYSGAGITFLNEGSPVMNLAITGNTIGQGDWGIYGRDGVPVDGGEYGDGGVGGTVCAVITGNSVAGSGQGEAGIELDQNYAYTIDLPGYTGGADDVSAVESFLTGNNDGDGTPTAIATVSGSGGGFAGVSSC